MNRLLLFAIALLVVGIAAVALILLGTPADLNARAADILTDLSAGEESAVWQSASPEFQARYTQERFASMMKDFHGNLGAFRRILSTSGEGRPAAPDESAGVVSPDGLTFEIEYEKGKAFCFMVLDDNVAPPQLRELLLRKSR